ncbi:hypothetical protein PIB30_074275, partial [Stylosanthes scabra]|nr:hypothetical protein [Stylosanthes scabra]
MEPPFMTVDDYEYEYGDALVYDENYSGNEAYLEDEEELGEELENEEVLEELEDYGEEFEEHDYDEAYGLNSVEDLLKLDFSCIGEVEIDKFHFGTLPIALEFYNKFAKSQGFSARKHKNWKDSNKETYIQRF